MLNYYDEIKNDVLEVLEEDDNAKNILQSENSVDTIIDNLVDYLIECDEVTGNLSGSYYMNSYKSRIHCYNYDSDVREALGMYGYVKELELFKIFVRLVEDGYLNVDNMKIDDDALYDEESEYRWYIVNNVVAIEYLNFETLDVITRCYKLSEVVTDVVKNILK